MSLVYIVMGLALIQYMYFGFQVGGARGRFGVPAPAITGNEQFERYFRVQQNTLELIVVLVPALWIFATYLNPQVAAALGVVYLVGRVIYFIGYIKDPAKRAAGFGLSFLPIAVLLIGGLYGAIRATLTG